MVRSAEMARPSVSRKGSNQQRERAFLAWKTRWRRYRPCRPLKQRTPLGDRPTHPPYQPRRDGHVNDLADSSATAYVRRRTAVLTRLQRGALRDALRMCQRTTTDTSVRGGLSRDQCRNHLVFPGHLLPIRARACFHSEGGGSISIR